MSKRNNSGGGIVYSTDPGFSPEQNTAKEQPAITPPEQKIKLRLETKHRAGKAVTLIENFTGTTADKEDIGKKLKSFCGTGGSVKEGEILVQGDHREKILAWLLKNGYKQTKKI